MAYRTDYVVQFINNWAFLYKKALHAAICFSDGTTCVITRGGFLQVKHRTELRAAVDDLSSGQWNTIGGNIEENGNQTMRLKGDATIFWKRNGDSKRVIREIKSRMTGHLEGALEQAEVVGALIDRARYSNIDLKEFLRVGASTLDRHGFGIFEDGKLVYTPINKPEGRFPAA